MHKSLLDYIKRPNIIVMLAIVGILVIFNILELLLTIHHQDFKVASRYAVGGQTVIATGNWYGLYGFGLLVLFDVIFNLFAAWRLVMAERTRMATAAIVLTIFILGCAIFYGHAIIGLAGSF